MSSCETKTARLNAARILSAHLAVRLQIDSLPVQADGSTRSWPFAPAHETATSSVSLHLMHHDAFTQALSRPAFSVFFGNIAVNALFTAFAAASGSHCNPGS